MGLRRVLAYFGKSESLAPSGDIVIDADAHNTTGPLGVSVRSPVIPGRGNSSRRLSRPGSRVVTTTGATTAARRRRLAATDQHAEGEALEHLPRVPRG